MRRSHQANADSSYQYGNYNGFQGGDGALESESDRLTDELKGKISNLKSLTIDIGSEIRSQNGMLGEMDDEFDSVGGFLAKAMGRVKKLSSGSHNHVVLYLVLFSLFIFFILWMLIKFN